VAQDDRAIDGAGRGRGPASGEPGVEELVGGRAVVPHGDRGDAAESRGVEYDERIARATHDIVRVLVLDDHLEDLVPAVQDIFEGLDADETRVTRHAPGYRDEQDLG